MGWTIIAVHDSQESWERFRDGKLMPTMSEGIQGGFPTPAEEKTFEVKGQDATSGLPRGCVVSSQEIREALKGLKFDSPQGAPYPYYSMSGGVRFDDRGDNVKWQPQALQFSSTAPAKVRPSEV